MVIVPACRFSFVQVLRVTLFYNMYSHLHSYTGFLMIISLEVGTDSLAVQI